MNPLPICHECNLPIQDEDCGWVKDNTEDYTGFSTTKIVYWAYHMSCHTYAIRMQMLPPIDELMK